MKARARGAARRSAIWFNAQLRLGVFISLAGGQIPTHRSHHLRRSEVDFKERKCRDPSGAPRPCAFRMTRAGWGSLISLLDLGPGDTRCVPGLKDPLLATAARSGAPGRYSYKCPASAGHFCRDGHSTTDKNLSLQSAGMGAGRGTWRRSTAGASTGADTSIHLRICGSAARAASSPARTRSPARLKSS